MCPCRSMRTSFIFYFKLKFSQKHIHQFAIASCNIVNEKVSVHVLILKNCLLISAFMIKEKVHRLELNTLEKHFIHKYTLLKDMASSLVFGCCRVTYVVLRNLFFICGKIKYKPFLINLCIKCLPCFSPLVLTHVVTEHDWLCLLSVLKDKAWCEKYADNTAPGWPTPQLTSHTV